MAERLTLYVCHIDEGGPKPHACRRAHEALRAARHEYDKVVFARGRIFGLFTKGRRPELKEMSGQEKLPVLQFPDGTTLAGAPRSSPGPRRTLPRRVHEHEPPLTAADLDVERLGTGP